MSVPVAILGVVLFALVALVVSAPLRAAAGPEAREAASGEPLREQEPQPLGLDDLHSQRDAKYREIRDAELDFRTGKLSAEDYQTIDAQLRAEALEILDRLQDAEDSRSS